MRNNLAIAILSLTLLLPAVSNARDYGGYRNSFGQVYLGLKYGEVTLADDVPENGSDIRNGGFMFGKQINDTLAWEFDYSSGVSKDDDYFGSGFGAEVEILGAFLVAKTSGDLYFKGRLGYTRVTQEFGEEAALLDSSLDGEKNVYGIAYGIGGGYKIGETGAVELEYTIYPSRDLTIDTGTFLGEIDLDLEMDFVSVAYVWSFE